MSFSSLYRDCMKSNIQALVIKGDSKDSLLGYRAFLYNPLEEKRYVYDFAISSDLFDSPDTQDLHEFLTRITRSAERIALFDNGKGKLVSKQELSSNYTVTELSSKARILKLLKDIRDVYIIAGKYSLKKGV